VKRSDEVANAILSTSDKS